MAYRKATPVLVNIKMPVDGTGPCGYCDTVGGGKGTLTVIVGTGSILRGFCSEVCCEAWLRSRRKRGGK